MHAYSMRMRYITLNEHMIHVKVKNAFKYTAEKMSAFIQY